jgi:2-oxoglutarate dehydrogenase E1 component
MDRFDFVNRSNADYMERLYEQYQREPRSLDQSWQAYFAGFESAGGRRPAEEHGAPLTIGLHNLVHTYRELGHCVAKLDPLGHDRPSHPLLALSQFGISEDMLDQVVGRADFYGPTNGTVRDLVEKLRDTYCRTIGVEYQNISDKAQREWLALRMEPILNRPPFTPEESRAILFQLIASEEFELFLGQKFVNSKRFSLEGGEALVPLLNTMVDDGAKLKVDEVCMGMAHRGRLNVLAHVLNKPYEVLFSEFMGTIVEQSSDGDGDVKYHLGYSNDRPAGDRTIHIALSPNPSHLELIDPVVQGIVRAKQSYKGDKDHGRVVPLLIHGDAAFTGQGIVSETLNLSELEGYRTGGTIHIIVNNQIGFTATPRECRFTPYPTDVAKMIQAPIFHVNGDDPEAVVHAGRLAIAFREEFRCDVLIDLWCYRRRGHNETDEPEYTQPVMYREIKAHKSVRELYAERLIREGKITAEQVESMRKVCRERMEAAAKLASEFRPRQRTAAMNPLWKGYTCSGGCDWSAKTAVPRETLTRIAENAAKLPADFTIHPKLKRVMQARLDAVKTGKGIDWGGGEMLALATLLLEGTPIRFTGQDVQRGTFSHRHAVLHDYNNGKTYTPLSNLAPGQAKLTIINTMLSELAVLGFEYGFSSGDPRNLVIWEAQFGDFVNGAQPIIDQMIAAAESKWRLSNGLVMLLPHGFEGAGPEHSNAYLNRFLGLCAEENMQVAVPSNPAQYFHLLRRQIHRKFRKPLVLMMPKFLLRYEPANSKLEDFAEGSAFQPVIDDPASPERDGVTRVLFCCGKIYYFLDERRQKEKLKNVAIVRMEQLYPFPKKEVQAILARYRKAQDICWVQDEPVNRGAWSYAQELLRELLPDPAVLNYYGRDASASPATGSHKMHEIESEEIICHALELPSPPDAAAPVVPATTPAVTAGSAQAAPTTAQATAPIVLTKQTEESKKV